MSAGTPPAPEPESTADRARRTAERFRRLPFELVESFALPDPGDRVSRMREVATAIFGEARQVIRWFERRRTEDTAGLVKHRLHTALQGAVEHAAADVPEYAGGVVARVERHSPAAGRVAAWAAFTLELAVSLGEWAGEIEADEVPEVPTIWAHGGRAYSRDGVTSYLVTEDEDSVLQSFLELGRAVDAPGLVDHSGVDNPPRVIKRLRERYGGVFADAIRTPGGVKGAGGYFALVRRVGP